MVGLPVMTGILTTAITASSSSSDKVVCFYQVLLHISLPALHLQVGTGVMVGLPGQTLRDLAGDIRFFRQMNANMIGMGPYITGMHVYFAETAIDV
jgi:hypothetical protein